MPRGAKSTLELHAIAEKRRAADMREIRKELVAIRKTITPATITFDCPTEEEMQKQWELFADKWQPPSPWSRLRAWWKS